MMEPVSRIAAEKKKKEAASKDGVKPLHHLVRAWLEKKMGWGYRYT
jgi:hypothetical protein